MKTYLLTVSYDGTPYHGWQSQKGQNTVQDEVEKALSSLVGVRVPVTASGRTDEGVHALGQAVSFACETSVPAKNLAAALNSLLPQDIRAIECKEAAKDFDARKSAKRKTYAYRFYLSPHVLPPIDRYAHRIDSPLDTELMNKACSMITGRRDLKRFYCLGSSAKTTVRNIFACSVEKFEASGIMPQMYEFRICGDGFLYKTVRLLAGALLALDCGKITLDDMRAALDGEEGRVPRVPAPAKGLTLVSVEYDFF